VPVPKRPLPKLNGKWRNIRKSCAKIIFGNANVREQRSRRRAKSLPQI